MTGMRNLFKPWRVVLLLLIVVGVFAVRLLFLPSSNPKLDLAHDLNFDVYDAAKITRSVNLPADSPVTAKLRKVIEDEAVQWTESYITFAPRILVNGEKFSITVQPSKIIVNYENRSGKWIQVTRELPDGFFEEIQDDLTREKWQL
jgi:hypothetical protein